MVSFIVLQKYPYVHLLFTDGHSTKITYFLNQRKKESFFSSNEA